MRACEQTVLYVMHAVRVYSVYTARRIVGTTFQYSETACSDRKKTSFTAHHIARNVTTMTSIA